MGIGSQSVEFIRQFFRQTEYDRAPYVPATASGGMSNSSSSFSYGMTGGSLHGVADYLRLDADIVARYMDYEDMDDSPIVSSCYDIYADDATQIDPQTGKSVWINCEDEDIRAELDTMLHKQLHIEEHIWGMTRMICKYGNLFQEIVAKQEQGVIALNTLSPPTVRRIQVPKEVGYDPAKPEQKEMNWDTLGYIYDPRGVFKVTTKQFIDELKYKISGDVPKDRPAGCAIFEGWEVAHYRLLGKTPDSAYGFGISEPARWIFKRLLLLEDSIILHRLTRAPSRYAFYVDVSGVPPNETPAYLNRVKQGLKKSKFVNPNSGKMDQKYNPISQDEDFFLGVRDGKESTRVESLQGPIYDHIEDIKFFENKLFAALKVPKPFLTYEESTAKTNLSAEDARFARTVLRIQRETRNGLKRVCKVHLAAKGINPDNVDFEVCMSTPSAIFELAQLEIKAAELDLAEKYTGWADKYWIKTHILGWSDDQVREAGQPGEDGGSSGGSGDLQAALDKRGTPGSGGGEKSSSSSPEKETVIATDADTVGAEVASKATRSDIIMSAVKRNTEKLLERLEKSQHKTSDKSSDKKLKEIAEALKDLRHTVDRTQTSGRDRK